MEQIVVKTEMEGSGEILVFYVDESNGNVESAVATIDNLQNVQDIGTEVQQLQDSTAYIVEDVEDTMDDVEMNQPDSVLKERWVQDEVNRLLVFYIDNKDIFLSGSTKKKHLWSVACKTMLAGKSPESCEIKLRSLKRKYAHIRVEQQKGIHIVFPYFDLCHKAFHDDHFVNTMLNLNIQSDTRMVKMPVMSKPDDGIVIVKGINLNNTRTSDNKVEIMLNLYIKYKKEFQKEYWRKDLWERIAMEMGEEDAEYWHKRFLNFKQHYLRMLSKRIETGTETVNWPYMSLFDEIYKDDKEFQRKVALKPEQSLCIVMNGTVPNVSNDWTMTEKTVLVKYFFDSYDEFQDPTIPDDFLWNEVGRLLDKKPESCKEKFLELKTLHLNKYIEGEYELRNRIPLSILFDNIIAKDTEILLCKERRKPMEQWKTKDLDELVQYFYDNIEMFKDPVCYYVCWASIAVKLNKSINSCRAQWEDLTSLYKNILDDKKENPDMQIDWRYIELFDRIFDYGMDTNLMFNFPELESKNIKNEGEKIGVRKVKINYDNDHMDNGTDDEEYDERGYTKRTKRGIGDSKAFKILEYYQKNKEKFSTTQRKKQVLWEILAKQIGISAEQCAHRFRNLKQVYTAYVQREIDKPEMPILWPYYALCKKVFGYRAIKSKLKNSKLSEDEDWSAKEIKQIINYFSQNFAHISEDEEDPTKWSTLAKDIGKSEKSCMEKFLELRKSYRKLKTMKENNAEVKVSWKYFNLFDEIYSTKSGSYMDQAMDDGSEHIIIQAGDRADSQEDDDYQCIIVIPDGQDISDMEGAQIIIQQNQEEQATEIKTKVSTKWRKNTKKRLLILYWNYIRSQKGKEINPTDMWKEIAFKLGDKTPLSCRKMFAKLKSNFTAIKDDDVNKKKTPYYSILKKILLLKPKFVKKGQRVLQEGRTYKDVPLPTGKVEQALQYYLLHIEKFLSPRFEKKYLWTELSNFVSEPVTKVFNKVNYLKQVYNIETDEVAGEKTLFGELLKGIITKEVALKTLMENEPKISYEDNGDPEWSDEEIERLLTWYLTNLEQFKDPQYSRKYLWSEVSSILKKSPLACSKKMTEIRTQYRNMVKENSEELNDWKFYSLCQKIYGTGKKNDSSNS